MIKFQIAVSRFRLSRKATWHECGTGIPKVFPGAQVVGIELAWLGSRAPAPWYPSSI
jgi:hypothetical protein